MFCFHYDFCVLQVAEAVVNLETWGLGFACSRFLVNSQGRAHTGYEAPSTSGVSEAPHSVCGGETSRALRNAVPLRLLGLPYVPRAGPVDFIRYTQIY